MPSRETSPPHALSQHRSSRLQKEPPRDILRKKASSANLRAVDAPQRTLSPASSNAMNRRPSTDGSAKVLSSSTNGPAGTIRSVPSSDYRLDVSPNRHGHDSPSRSGGNMPITRAHSPIPMTSHPPPSSLAVRQAAPPSSLARSISTEFGLTKSYSNGNFAIAEDNTAQNQPWSSAVGRANLGKSGRVIEKLMAENDMLRRDIKLERIRADDAKQELKMGEAKAEQERNDYEGKLHDAAINKTLLKRRERQLTDLKTQVDSERLRAAKALESEMIWREAAEREKVEAKAEIDRAHTYAALMEGRNNTLSGHWKDQRVQLDREVDRMRKEIKMIQQERKEDDRQISVLKGISDQQAEQLERLKAEKDTLWKEFERYKAAQEELLRDIKTKAKTQIMENEKRLEEATNVLHQLKWALNVKKNVPGAQ